MAQMVVPFVDATFWLISFEDFAFLINNMCRLASEIGPCQFLELLEADVADAGQYHLVGAIVVSHEVEYILTVESFHQLGGAQYVACQRMSFENHLFKQIINLVGRRVQVGVDLVQDDFFFLGQFILGEGGVEGDIGKEVEAAFVVLLEEGGLQAGLFLGGEGVEVATHIVEAA